MMTSDAYNLRITSAPCVTIVAEGVSHPSLKLLLYLSA